METTKYINGKIYKIISNDNHYYIGSTINTLNKRLMWRHTYIIRNLETFKNKKTSKLFK